MPQALPAHRHAPDTVAATVLVAVGTQDDVCVPVAALEPILDAHPALAHHPPGAHVQVARDLALARMPTQDDRPLAGLPQLGKAGNYPAKPRLRAAITRSCCSSVSPVEQGMLSASRCTASATGQDRA